MLVTWVPGPCLSYSLLSDPWHPLRSPTKKWLYLFPVPGISSRTRLLLPVNFLKPKGPFWLLCFKSLSTTTKGLHFQDKKRATHPPKEEDPNFRNTKAYLPPWHYSQDSIFYSIWMSFYLFPRTESGLLLQQGHIHDIQWKVPPGLPDAQKQKIQVEFLMDHSFIAEKDVPWLWDLTHWSSALNSVYADKLLFSDNNT